MSQCPFGVQVLQGISPVLKKIGANIDFKVDYIGQIQGDQLTSMHGENEVKGNIAQLCLIKYMPENYAYMNVFDCMNQDMKAIPGNWEGCADQAQVSPDLKAKVKACYDGQEGKDLLKASFEKAQQNGARGSPTMFLAGKPYQGGRKENDFLRSICGQFPEGQKPEVCASIPPPVKISMIIVNDKRCTDRSCDTNRMEGILKGMFPGLEVTQKLDWESEEAKKLYADEGLKYLPAYLFDQAIEKGEDYARIQRALNKSKTGTYWVLAMGAKHDPAAEICDNKVDDTGNGKIDCDDPTCASTLVCRQVVPGRVELFVMSQCPFGVKALDAMKDVLQAFGDEIKLEVHYIGNEANGKPTSMHGENEVKGNIVQLCAAKALPENNKYMDLVWCMNKDMRAIPGNWEACAKAPETGISEEKFNEIKACYEGGEGEKMLLEDFKIATSLDISGSPSWVANGKNKFSGIDAKTVQQNICTHNPGFKGCSVELKGPEAPKGPAPSCG